MHQQHMAQNVEQQQQEHLQQDGRVSGICSRCSDHKIVGSPVLHPDTSLLGLDVMELYCYLCLWEVPMSSLHPRIKAYS